MKTLMETAKAARAAAAEVAQLSTEEKNAALLAMADALEASMGSILAANAADMERERANGMSSDLLDRLALNEGRVRDMALGLRQVAELPDPVGEVMAEWDRPNGLHIKKVRVMREALAGCGITPDAVCLVEERGHGVVDQMLTMRGYIDLIVPRGSARLINNAVEKATVPILQTGTGNCHVYIDRSADYAMAEAITINAKTQRTSVCNCAETLLVQEEWAEEHLRELLKALTDRNVELHGDEPAASYTTGMIPATEADWADEYLRLAMAVKVVPDVKAAVEHINRYGTMHTECIVTADAQCADYFLKNVDAAVVNWNASTRFTDGFEFGFGAELGISTQKLHARGPMGLTEITSYKYQVIGTGQVRP